MASGTYNLSLEHPSTSVSFQGKLEWTSTSNGATANTSLVEVKLYARKQGSSTATSGAFKGYITIDGTKTTFSQNKSVSNSWVLISTSSKTVSHNPNGTKSITIAGAVGKVSGTTLANIESNGSTSITLDTISRYATLNPITQLTDLNPTISISAPAYTQFTSNQICVSTDGTNPIDSWKTLTIDSATDTYLYQWTQTEETALYSASNNTNKYANVYVILKTVMGGSTYTDRVSTKYYPLNPQPTWTPNYTFKDDNPLSVAITGDDTILIGNNISHVIMSFDGATAIKGASISGYQFKAAGGVYTTNTDDDVILGTIDANGTIDLEGTATDTRGYTVNKNSQFTLLPFFPPVFKSIDLHRLNNYEDTTYLKVSCEYAPFNNTNQITIQYRYKEVGGTFGSWTTIANDTQITLSLDKSKQFDFEFKVEDLTHNSSTATKTLNKGLFPFFISTLLNSVGINGFPTHADSLEVFGDLYYSGNNELVNKSIISVSPNGDTSLTGTTDTPITLVADTTIGSGLTISSGKVVIGDDISYIKISAKANYNTLNASAGLRYLKIKKGTTEILMAREYVGASSTGAVITLPTQIIPVASGDIISVSIQGLNGDVLKGDSAWTYIYIETIK